MKKSKFPSTPGYWADSGNYPYPDSDDWASWAWEFLRRNSRYQDDYENYKKHNAEARKTGDHPLPDDTPLDHFYTYPRAKPGQVLADFLEEHDDRRKTYMFWDEYIRRMWWIKTPVIPTQNYSSGEIKFITPHRRTAHINLSSAPKDERRVPFDFVTELAPKEILVRVRLLYDTEKDIDKIATYLKEKISKYSIASSKDKYILNFLYVILRLWDFELANAGQKEKLTRDAFKSQLYVERLWKNYVRTLRRRKEIEKSKKGAKEKWPSNTLMTILHRHAVKLINRRNYIYLLRLIPPRKKRQEKTK